LSPAFCSDSTNNPNYSIYLVGVVVGKPKKPAANNEQA